MAQHLHEIFDNPLARKARVEIAVPGYLLDNVKYAIRPYQEEALKRYIYFDKNDFEGKPCKPFHLLYNMATGSGKTLIMAGLMLYLYAKGYRHFLFFVNSNNIIKKTKDNFLNPQANKYLFNNKLVIDGKEVRIKEIENFEEADAENINIKFTTVQQLHKDLQNTKENSVTIEDFTDKEIVLIADEAHHLSTATKQKNLKGLEKPSWENTVTEVLNSNANNILLEFTATLDYESWQIAEKYKDKVIYRYDLAQFRVDKYSKEINLFRSLYEEKERIIQALILNLYRQELATSHHVNLKPVMLFKAKRTIAESERNKDNFHQLIDDFSAEQVEHIQQTSTVPIIEKAFYFFSSKEYSSNEIAKRIKFNFKEENCISANNESEAETNQMLLNTLEDDNNPIRAVFAVQKLNEGWDVLNLFDIVRLYESRDSRAGNLGKTTIAEAQLIGRGARYFPFTLEEGQDPYTRKFDDDVANNLKILEELYYHTKEDNRYISELKKALVDTGIYEDENNFETKKLCLKPDFKKSDFYKTGQVFYNKKVAKSYNNIRSFSDLGVKKKNFKSRLSSGSGKITGAFAKEEEDQSVEKTQEKDIAIKNIPTHIIRFALTKKPFYCHDNLRRYFPYVISLSDFMENECYLGDLEINFSGTKQRLKEITHKDYLFAISNLLGSIETEIKSNITEYEGSDYVNENVCKVFKDKEIRVAKGSERANEQYDVVEEAPWYVYNANYGTSEEKEFVKTFARLFENLEKENTNIYLIRNERELKIFDAFGRAFEPDFILFCERKGGGELIYQVFIEPKGTHLMPHDAWKEKFLMKIRNEKAIIEIEMDKYRITGAPFYNNKTEKEFKEILEKILNEK